MGDLLDSTGHRLLDPGSTDFCNVYGSPFTFNYSNTPTSALLGSMFWGALWGVGGLTFGLSMRYLGVALGQSIALGFCGAFGTLIPPMVAGQDLFSSRAGWIMLIGVAISIAGIAIVGYAGALKSQSMSEEDKKKAVKEFALKKGLLIAI